MRAPLMLVLAMGFLFSVLGTSLQASDISASFTSSNAPRATRPPDVPNPNQSPEEDWDEPIPKPKESQQSMT